MNTQVITEISRYEGRPTAAASRCPDCGAPLVVVYQESHFHGLELALSCAADCGYSRKPRTTIDRPSRSSD